MAHEKNHDYHILNPSIWPFMGAVSAFVLLFGSVLFFHDSGPWVMLVGFALTFYTMYSWWADVIDEAHQGDHTPVVSIGLRYGFIMFIMSDVLGVFFTILQAYEYSHAAFGFSGNVYGGTFYMATGFHGVHVIIGTIFLLVCLIRTQKGHFTPEHHIGFEAAAWYWHFVDVVWLFLFFSIYVWGA